VADGPSDAVFKLSDFPAHLGQGAKVLRMEQFDGTPSWYQRYGAATESDGVEGRLVSMHTFSESWDSWEMHPLGDELVICTEGTIVLHQDIDGEEHTVELHAGEAVVNPPGAWHTADVTGRCSAVFVTAGRGTEVRPR
jgi:quercetin dioxygenase-like cupin family protein